MSQTTPPAVARPPRTDDGGTGTRPWRSSGPSWPGPRRPAGIAARPLRRPILLAALAVMVVCVPVRDVSAASSGVTPADLCAVGLVVLAAVRVARGARLRLGAVGGFAALMVVALAASTMTSADPATSVVGFIRYAEIFVVVPLAVAVSITDRMDVLILCAALLFTAVLEGTVGVFQYLTGSGASYAGIDVRAVGTFGAFQVMAMAEVVSYGIVVALGLGLALRGRARVVLLATAGALAVPLLLSFSRGSLIAVLAAVAAMLLVAGPRLALRSAAIAAVVLILVSALGVGTGPGGGSGVAARIASITTAGSTPDRSVGDRYALWGAATRMWAEHPVTGVGLKRFPEFRDSHAGLTLSAAGDAADPRIGFHHEPLLSPHNLYLLFLSEQGLLGAVAFIGLLSAAGVIAVRRARAAPDRRGRSVAGIAAVGGLVFSAVDFLYGDFGGPSTVVMSIMIGFSLWWAAVPRRGGMAS